MKKRALVILAGVAAAVALTGATCTGYQTNSPGCALIRSEANNPGSTYTPFPPTWHLEPSGIDVATVGKLFCWPVDGGGN